MPIKQAFSYRPPMRAQTGAGFDRGYFAMILSNAPHAVNLQASEGVLVVNLEDEKMGLRGPRKQPSRLQELKGNPGNRRKVNEPRPVTTDQQPPSYLQGVSLAKWNEVAAVLEAAGLLTDADRDSLGMYCVHFELYMQALESVKRDGLIYEFYSKKQKRMMQATNPQAVNLGKLEAAMLKTAQHFGLTPSTRLDVPKLNVVDPLAEFVGT